MVLDYKSRWLSTTPLVFLLLLLLRRFVISRAQLESGDDISTSADDNETAQLYYITTSTSDTCPTDTAIPCLTLNQFASNKEYYLTNNSFISLILQEGNHHLESELTVTNMSQFTLEGEGARNKSVVTIECSQIFTFENITRLSMRFLTFLGCTQIVIQSIGEFSLDNCTFNGLGRNGTALNIIETTSVNITSCLFLDNQGSSKPFEFLFNSNQFITGGAIISTQSSISIHNSTFERNIAEVGGSIFAEQESEIILTECVFSINSNFIGFGSAVFAMSGSSITLKDCTFQNANISQRTVYESDTVLDTNSIVGVLGSNVTIQTCIYRNNKIPDGSLVYCLLSNISIMDTIFEHNNANGFIHTSSDTMFSSIQNVLEILNCTFINNTYDSAIVSCYQMQVKIINSSFEHNSGAARNRNSIISSGLKNIVYISESNLLIQRCMYVNNCIEVGYLVFGEHSNLSIKDSRFEHNDDVIGLIYIYGTSSVLEIHKSIFMYNNKIDLFMLVAYQVMQVEIQQSGFVNNQLGEHGSVMFCYQCHTSLLIQCKFTRNVASFIIGLYTATNLTVSESTFVANINDMGIIYILDGENDFITNNTFANNTIMVGAVIFIAAKSLRPTLISRSRFNANNGMGSIYVRGKVLHIEQCNFFSNTAQYGAVLHAVDSSTVMSDVNIANNVAYIAGVILLYNESLITNDISIVSNTAGSAVVGLTSSTGSFRGNTKFFNNNGSISVVTSSIRLEGNLKLTNNSPFNNRVIPIEEGGAITALQSSIVISGTVVLVNNSALNGGAMYILESSFSISGNVTIANNSASEFGGGIYLFQSRLNIQGECSISKNTAVNGGGVYAVSSTVTLEEHQNVLSVSRSTSFNFNSNTARLGGAIFLSTNTKIYALLIGSFVHRINFTKNTADYGGALYIDDQTNSDMCNRSSSTLGECFFQILALNPGDLMDIIEVQNEALEFIGNTANFSGDVIFGGLLDRCTLNTLTPSRKQIYGVNYIQNISNINDVELISSHPVRLCFCIDDYPDCNIHSRTESVQKGKDFSISVVAVDQVNHTLESEVEAFLSSNDGVLGESQKKQTVTANCSILTYNIVTPRESEELLLNAGGPCENALASQRRVQLIFDNCTCPIGFTPAASFQRNCQCECHFNLSNFVLLENCFPSDGTFKPSVNTWISYTEMIGINDYYLLIHPQCPYDYCTREQVNISLRQLNGSNALCNFNRAGTLCGACQPGFSLSFGSSRCMKCNGHVHWEGALVGLLLLQVITGIAIVCIILILNLTVAMGTLNGILFYANIVYGNASVYFNNLPSPSFPSILIAWLNLDAGFDVCLFEGIDTFAKTLLQLVFPIYLIILVIAVIIISKYSQRFSNLIGKKDPVATLATLILLSYAKILSTVITMLSFTRLDYPEGTRILWKPDATIGYFKHPKHVILFFVAMVILLLSTTYTLILISWQLLIRFPNWKVFAWISNPKFSSFIGAYHAPFTSKYRYWTGLLLLLRVILFLVSAINLTGSTQEPLLATTLVIGVLFYLNAKSVYRKTHLNIIEMISLANILTFTIFTWYATDTNNMMLQNFVAHISVTICCILLIVVISLHVCKHTEANDIIMREKLYSALRNKKLLPKKKSPAKHNVDLQFANYNRDVNIFELVNNPNDTTKPDTQGLPSATATRVSHSTIEIPKPKEDQSQCNKRVCNNDNAIRQF